MNLGLKIPSNSGLDQTNSVGLIRKQSKLHLCFHFINFLC
jgi:hypothetical protein